MAARRSGDAIHETTEVPRPPRARRHAQEPRAQGLRLRRPSGAHAARRHRRRACRVFTRLSSCTYRVLSCSLFSVQYSRIVRSERTWHRAREALAADCSRRVASTQRFLSSSPRSFLFTSFAHIVRYTAWQ